MPLPLAPLLPLALRIGAVTALGYGLRRMIVARSYPGRTDQRAEDALDDLDEGLAMHRPQDAEGQKNATLRVRRKIRFRGKTYEFDAGAIARLRLKESE